MSNPYVEAAFEVFDEALDELTRAEEWAEENGITKNLELYAYERKILELLKGDFHMKLNRLNKK